MELQWQGGTGLKKTLKRRPLKLGHLHWKNIKGGPGSADPLNPPPASAPELWTEMCVLVYACYKCRWSLLMQKVLSWELGLRGHD